MTLTLADPPVVADSDPVRTVAARRAVIRWSWRLFQREWRQQLLVLALIVLAVAATVVGATVATNSPAPPGSGFGTAQYRATLSGSDPHLRSDLAAIERSVGRTDVIENQTQPIPGSTATYSVRAQDPHGAFGSPMLSLVSGRYPSGAGQVALSTPLADALGLRVGDVWHQDGLSERVVGLVENPQSLLDEFALVPPGQVTSPTAVTVLFDSRPVGRFPRGVDVQSRSMAVPSNAFNPETISLAGLTIGMLLIALVSVGGFTVLAQRRLRSLGMLASLGATRRQVSLVVRANGAVVGVVGAVLGAVLGLVLWLAYRPHLEASSHHRIGALALPWTVVALAMVLAVVATYLAARRPARAVTRIPIVAALSGRPPPPKQVSRSALPGIVVLAGAFLLLGYSGSQNSPTHSGGSFTLVLGLILLIPGVILLAPFCLSTVARLSGRAPIAIRLAVRDLSRYRARAGSALAAISIGVLIAVIIAIVAAARYGNVLDYAGPNLASNQLVVYVATPGPSPGPGPDGKGGQGGPPAPTAAQLASQAATARQIGAEVGATHVVELDQPSANIDHSGGGRDFSGQLYIATPALLRALGIPPSQIEPNADIVTSRPGFSGVSGLSLSWCAGTVIPEGQRNVPGGGEVFSSTCSRNGALAHPVVQELSALPSGTSAPNIVLTEHAMHTLGLQSSINGWLVTTTQPLSAQQIREADQTAGTAGMTVESKDDAPTSAEVINWATFFGMALALAILAMSVGLIRSETAGDLRTLTATGAGSFSRRMVTAATAGSLGFLGALLGTGAGYLGVIGWIRSNSLEGGVSALGNVPVKNLLVILVGIPLLATVAGWLLAGREPAAMAHQPLE